MEKLFAALSEQHPDFSAIDVRFLADSANVNDQNVNDLDQAFADAIVGAVDLDIETLSKA